MVDKEDDVLAKFKILILGASSVGKSSLLLRFTNDSFDMNQNATIGVDFKSKKVNIDDNIVCLALWDTSGHERFRAVPPLYFRNAQAAILVYDVTNQSSLDKLKCWLEDINTYCDRKYIVKMVIGNKTDEVIKRTVSREDGLRFATRHNMLFLEASAKTSDGVQAAFEEVVRKIIEQPGLWKVHSPEALQLNDAPVGQIFCGSCWRC